MSLFKKIAGVAAGVSAVAVLGAAIAQDVPPTPLVPNHPIAAGQQSTHLTPMGETGVLAPMVVGGRTATLTPQPEPVAVIEPVTVVEPVAVVEPVTVVEPVAVVPAPEPQVATAPAPEPSTSTMGAGPAEPEPMRPRADRN